MSDQYECDVRIQALERENKALREALREAEIQIRYLHDRFKETGTGNAVIARIQALLAEQPATAQQGGGE